MDHMQQMYVYVLHVDFLRSIIHKYNRVTKWQRGTKTLSQSSSSWACPSSQSSRICFMPCSWPCILPLFWGTYSSLCSFTWTFSFTPPGICLSEICPSLTSASLLSQCPSYCRTCKAKSHSSPMQASWHRCILLVFWTSWELPPCGHGLWPLCGGPSASAFTTPPLGAPSCLSLLALSWVLTIAHAILHTLLKDRLFFCAVIPHFFCDTSILLKLSCSDTRVSGLEIFFMGGLTFVSYPYSLLSYAQIVFSILKVSSAGGIHKAFSIRGSYLFIISLFYEIIIGLYLYPLTNTSTVKETVVAMMYTVVMPMLNLTVYSLRKRHEGSLGKSLSGKKTFLFKMTTLEFLYY